jgi:hypothetical protein
MTKPDDYSFEGCRQKLRDATRIVLDAEAVYERAINEAADAEAIYRSEHAKAYQAHRTGGAAVAEADTLARGDVVMHSRERDYRAGMMRLALERLEDARDSRRSVWRLIEWARGVALAQAGQTDERVPASQWP